MLVCMREFTHFLGINSHAVKYYILTGSLGSENQEFLVILINYLCLGSVSYAR